MAEVTIAGIQATPVFLDRDETLKVVVERIDEAASAGARIIVFPEAFVPGYPDWVWRTKPFADGEANWYSRLFANSFSLDGPEREVIAGAAAEADSYVVLGVTEREDASRTLYNSLLFFGPDGSLLGKHRKLMPTGGERLVWGVGDGSGLRTYRTEYGRIGGLICWENYMPLARSALYGEGIDIYLAPTWDNSDMWLPTMRHIAREGQCYVVGVTAYLRGSDVPAEIPGRDEVYGDESDPMSRGNTVIVAPGGDVLAGPLIDEAGMVLATIDTESVSRQAFDVNGHYTRPDILRLEVDRVPRAPVHYRDGS